MQSVELNSTSSVDAAPQQQLAIDPSLESYFDTCSQIQEQNNQRDSPDSNFTFSSDMAKAESAIDILKPPEEQKKER
jgi:hypothetical protein